MLSVYSILTIQHFSLLRSKMNDAADLLALRIQDRLSTMQETSIYLSSFTDLDLLLIQDEPSLSTLSEYDNVLRSISTGDLSIEIMFHKSQLILISDYGLTNYQTFYDQEFLQELLSENRRLDRWVLRSYRQNIYAAPKPVLSYVRSLPLSSVRDQGYIIVSQSLSSLGKTASTYAANGLGNYAVWLDGMLLASSSDPMQTDGAEICSSDIEISVRASYWLPLNVMIYRSMPKPWLCICIWLLIIILCMIITHIIHRHRTAKLNLLVQEMRSEWESNEEDDDQEQQLYHIFENLSTELFHARQITHENMPLLQERFIGELIRTRQPIEQQREDLKRCGISLNAPYFAVIQVAPKEAAFAAQTYLMVRRNIQSQLSALGEVYSTYGDGSSILFIINTDEYVGLNEKIKKLCETMHDALESFLMVDVVFSVGLCEESDPHPYDAYVAARNQLSALLKLEKNPHDAVVLADSSVESYLQDEDVQRLCDAVQAQDADTLDVVFKDICSSYLTSDSGLKEMKKRCMVLLMRTYAVLAETDYLLPAESLVNIVQRFQQYDTPEEISGAIGKWYHELIRHDVESDVASNEYVESAIRFIDENYMHIQNVQEIGKKINVNPIYLNRLFKNATGKTVSGYLSEYRCERAKKLLHETQDTVQEISVVCGFSDVRSFIRYFKIYYEVTPTEYRRRIKS